MTNMIRKAGLNLILFLIMTGPAFAADVPRYEIFGGFSHLDTNIGDLNGFGASFTANFNEWFSLVSDYSGHFGNAGIYFADFTETDFDRWYFLVGPQFNGRAGKFKFFGRVLFGAALSQFDVVGTPGTQPQNQHARFTEFAMGVGVGVDVYLAKHFGLRLVQADWIRQFGDNSADDWELRLATGVLVPF